MRIHTTKDGTKIKLRDMTDSHLDATIRLMERKASEGITVCMGGGSCPDEFWYDEERLYGEAALEHMGYADYVKERDRRIPNCSATREAFNAWRGPRPASGYLRDIMAWIDEGERLWECWKSACAWKEDNPYVD